MDTMGDAEGPQNVPGVLGCGRESYRQRRSQREMAGAFYCRCQLEPLLALRAGEATMRGRDGQRVPKRAEAFWEEGGATEKRSFSVKKSEAE